MDDSKSKSYNDFSQSSTDEMAVLEQYNRRKRESLRLQSAHFEEWKDSDLESLSQKPPMNYEMSTVFVEDDMNSPPVLAGNWTPISMVPGQDQSIANRILRSLYKYSLKTLGFNISLKIELGEQSELWIMSREEHKNAVEQSVVKIGREIYTDRLFVKLGSHIGPNGEFRFFKTYEVPSYSSNLQIDYSDFGNDTIAVRVKAKKGHKQICKSSHFIPVFHPCNLMIAGVGSHVLITSLDVSQFRRRIQEPNESQCNCSII